MKELIFNLKREHTENIENMIRKHNIEKEGIEITLQARFNSKEMMISTECDKANNEAESKIKLLENLLSGATKYSTERYFYFIFYYFISHYVILFILFLNVYVVYFISFIFFYDRPFIIYYYFIFMSF